MIWSFLGHGNSRSPEAISTMKSFIQKGIAVQAGPARSAAFNGGQSENS